MEYIAPSQLLRELDRQLKRIQTEVDMRELERSERLAFEVIRQQLSFAQRFVYDFEMGDSRSEQVKHAANVRECLEKLRAAILQASEFGRIGPADVADMTGQIDRIEQLLPR